MVPIVKLVYNSNNYGLYVIVDGVYKPNYQQKINHIVSFLYDSIFSSCFEIDGESPFDHSPSGLGAGPKLRWLPCDGGN